MMNRLNTTIHIVVLLLSLSLVISSTSSQYFGSTIDDITTFNPTPPTFIKVGGVVTLWVDYKSKCTYACGRNASQPYNNLKDAIATVIEAKVSSATIMVEPGQYSGNKNKEIEIPLGVTLRISTVLGHIDNKTHPLSQIGSLTGMVTIDCQENGRAFNVRGKGTHLKLTGFVLSNCRHIKGGAIAVVNGGTLTTSNTVIAKNGASFGGGLYLEADSTAYLTRTLFYGNFATTRSPVMEVNSSSVHFTQSYIPCDPSQTSNQLAYVSQDENPTVPSSFISDDDSLVGQFTNINCVAPAQCRLPKVTTAQCTWQEFLSNSNNVIIQSPNIETRVEPTVDSCNHDSICDLTREDCISCPTDCSCNHPNSYLLTLPGTHKMLSLPHVTLTDLPSSGTFETYINQKHKKNNIMVQVDSCKLDFYLNGKLEFTVVESSYQEYKHSLHLIESPLPAKIRVVFACNSINPNSSFAVKYRDELSGEYQYIDGFYSVNICGDGIYNYEENYYASRFFCPKDKGMVDSLYSSITPKCGDNMCNEDNPQECPFDCYEQFTKTCREIAPPTKTDSIYMPTKEFLGALLNNQYLYALPGIDVFAHGIDILTGKSKDTRIFHFGYCEDTPYSTVHDLYRGLVYTIPYGLSGTPAPKCTYSSTSTFYKTSSSISQEMTKESGLEVSASASGGFWGYSVSASAAYSQDESVQMASSHEQQSEGSFIVSKVQCQTSKVVLTESDTKFHHLFLRDLVQANTIIKMRAVISKYGTAYLKSSVMGGTLKMVSIVSNHYASTTTESELKQNAELSLSIHASAPIGSVDASGSGSRETSTSESSRQEFTSNSKQSTIITEGGSPGAFSPDEFGQNTFSSWAQSVDLRPVPISPQLGYISDLIPKNWKVYKEYANSPDISIYDLWKVTENLYFLDLISDLDNLEIDFINRNNSVSITNYFIFQDYVQDRSVTIKSSDSSISEQITVSVNGGAHTSFWYPKTDIMLTGSPPINRVSIFDLVSSRIFQFPINSFTPAPTIGLIELRMQDFDASYLSTASLNPFKVHFTVYGTRGKSQHVETIINNRISNFYIVSITPSAENNQNDIGDLVSIRFMIQPRARDSANLGLKIKALNVIQHCPANHNPDDRVCHPNQMYLYGTANSLPIEATYTPEDRPKAIVYRNLSNRVNIANLVYPRQN